jgi:hypothetical protein
MATVAVCTSLRLFLPLLRIVAVNTRCVADGWNNRSLHDYASSQDDIPRNFPAPTKTNSGSNPLVSPIPQHLLVQLLVHSLTVVPPLSVDEAQGCQQRLRFQARLKQNVPFHLRRTNDSPELRCLVSRAPESDAEEWHPESPTRFSLNMDSVLVPKQTHHTNNASLNSILRDREAGPKEGRSTDHNLFSDSGISDDEVRLVKWVPGAWAAWILTHAVAPEGRAMLIEQNSTMAVCPTCNLADKLLSMSDAVLVRVIYGHITSQ